MKKIKHIPFILLFLLSLPAIYFLLIPGFYEPHDLHHLADIYQMARALVSGQIPPRLGPDFSFNYGYPLFNFYYVLPFYLGAFWYFITGSLTSGFEFVFIVSVLVSVCGMYLFLRQFTSKISSFAGAVLFLYTPYRAVQIYVRGAMGEAFALSLLPFVALAIVKLVKNPTRKVILCSTLVISLFILTHNYFFALSAPFLLFLFLVLVKNETDRGKVFKHVFVSAMLSVGITAYWWLPAIIEQRLVSSITPFPLIDHFPFLKQLIVPSWGYGSSVWGPGDEISFQIGLVNIFVVVLTSLFLLYKREVFKNIKIVVWGVAGFILSFILMNIRSYPIWKVLPFHDLVQFPWRLLSFTTFFSSILLAFLVQITPKGKRVYIALIPVVFSIVLTFNYFRPSKIFYKNDTQYLERFFKDPKYSEDYLLLSKWSDIRTTVFPKAKIETEYGAVKDLEEVNPVHWRSNLSLNENSKVTFNSYYFPGWTAKVDNRKVEIKPGKPYGQIEVDVPKGEHSIEFYWSETPLRKFADYISLISLASLFYILSPWGSRLYRKLND